MKDKKLPKRVVENPLVPSQKSFLPDNVTRLDVSKCEESIAKQLAFNAGSFSGPGQTSETADKLLEMEEKAEGCSERY